MNLHKIGSICRNKLFATLDTTVRSVLEQVPFLLSDTVGFIRKLPPPFTGAKSTPTKYGKAISSSTWWTLPNSNYEDHLKTVNETLKDIGVLEKPTLLIFNKIDLYLPGSAIDALVDRETKEEIERELQSRPKRIRARQHFYLGHQQGEY
ncbi:MAG: hypothetical protein R2788_14255 [Saprospiraceae bacterium]